MLLNFVCMTGLFLSNNELKQGAMVEIVLFLLQV